MDDTRTDSTLARAAADGDDEAFAALYNRYAPRIESHLARLLGDRHLAEDVTHEVFVSALGRLRQDRVPIAVGPWLFRIARNAAIDVHRRAQLVRSVPLADEPAGLTSGAEDEAEARQRISLLLGALDGLTATHRTVLVLRELEGLSNGEIAERMGVSRQAVEALLFRARSGVRREYDELTSGRRCVRVRRFLDATGDGPPRGRRELVVAARHLRSCRECRRHAWEVGAASVVLAEAPTAAALPLPALVIALAGRAHLLARNLLVPWSAGPPAVAPLGRTLAAIGVLALGGVDLVRREAPAARADRGAIVARADAPRAAAPVHLASARAGHLAPSASPPARAHAAPAVRRAVPGPGVAPRPARAPARPADPAAPPSPPPATPRPVVAAPGPAAPAPTPPEADIAIAVAATDIDVRSGSDGPTVRVAGLEADVPSPPPPDPPPDALPSGG